MNRPSRPANDAPGGVYVHFPFCAVRCSYCDFATVAGRDEQIETYLRALATEISSFQWEAPGRVDSVYLGGGTPSRMEPEAVARLLDTLARRFEVAPDTEITLEGNPESLRPERLRGFRDAGVTRISIGAQSLSDSVLRGCGRAHDAALALAVARDALGAGFVSVNVDLIAGLPGEDIASWATTLGRVADLGPDHVSVYLLETDKDTPLARSARAGRTVLADDDDLAAAYRGGARLLVARGFEHYEISNFARAGHRSRHNGKYWSDEPYAGFGLGAHAYFAGQRRANHRDLDRYLADVAAGRDPVAHREGWHRRRRLEEALMLGLRRAEGIDPSALQARYGIDPRREFAPAWERARAAGILDRGGTRIRLTESGRLRCNELFADLIEGAGV